MLNTLSIVYTPFSRKWLRRELRLVLLVGHVLLGIILSLILFSPLWCSRFPKHWSSMLVSGWSRTLCRICGLQVQCYGERVTGPTLFVANHISWLDVFALLSIFSVIFISKQEVKKWPVVGWLARRVGTLFMRRGQFEASALASNAVVNSLFNHSNVLFFPEGTCTDGTYVKRFHARMFQAAIETGVPVQPIALRYPLGSRVNSVVPFLGDETFLANLWRILGEEKLYIEVWFCPPVLAHKKKRRELADYAQAQVLNVLERYQNY